MATFQRPGSRQPSAFGVSFEVDRDASSSGAPPPPPFNPNARLAISDQRRKLPIYEHRTQLLYLVEHTATTIVVGETGSGKTTQLPQYLREAGWTRDGKMVACTQPRRVAAMTVAARVAEEVGCALGAEVGYSIRFEDVSTPGVTQLKFCTDGVLLREMMQDPLLTRYAVVMVDEAHERSLTTDVLLGLLKKVQRKRRDLRVIVSSATIQAERMAEFFNDSAVKKPRGGSGGGSGARANDVSAKDSASQLDSNDNNRTTILEPSRLPALLSVQGRTHAVQVHYLSQPANDYVAAAVEAVVNIHLEDLPGDVLVFLTGQEECERAVAWLREEERKLQQQQQGGGGGSAGNKSGRRGGTLSGTTSASFSSKKLRLHPVALYSGLPAAAQLAVFEPAARGTRKVVVATNVAETSVTIEGVVYVVDCMFAKQRCYNPLSGLESLVAAPISRASASQRAGRAGRVRPGHVFRLCTEEAFDELLVDTDVPEMQRSDLAGTVLQLKSLGIDNMMSFHWLAPPPAEAMIRALETLHALGALDNDARLAHPMGTRMAELPLHPPLARALLASAENRCAIEGATVVAMLSVQSIWAPGDRGVVDAAKAQFAVAEGDLVTFLNVWRGWEASGRSKKWAIANFVSHKSMLRVADVRMQLLGHVKRLGLPVKSALADATPGSEVLEALTRIRKSLAAGLFVNAARLQDEIDVNLADVGHAGHAVYRLVRGAGSEAARVKLRIHPSSVLFRCRPRWICFVTAQQNGSGWYDVQELLTLEPQWLTELAPHFYTQVPVDPRQRP